MKRLVPVLAVLIAARSVGAGDLEDLKATVQRELDAYAARDCKTVISLRTDPTVVAMPNAPEILFNDKAASLKDCADGTFERWNVRTPRSVVFSPRDYRYQLLGSTAVVAGVLESQITPKDGEPMKRQVRRVETWVKVEGQWRRAALTVTPVPSASPQPGTAAAAAAPPVR